MPQRKINFSFPTLPYQSRWKLIRLETACSPANIAALIASSAEPRFDAAMQSLLLGVVGVVLGTAAVLAL
jgi:hypothetical protein